MCKTMNISKMRIAVNSIAHTVYLHFEPPKPLMTENDRDLNDRILGGLKMIMTLNDFDPS